MSVNMIAARRREDFIRLKRDLILLDGWWDVIGAASALDYVSNVPSILEWAPKITCPVLYLRGDQEPAEIYPAEEFKEKCTGPCDIEIVGACGHFYIGREADVSTIVAEWLSRRLLSDRP